MMTRPWASEGSGESRDLGTALERLWDGLASDPAHLAGTPLLTAEIFLSSRDGAVRVALDERARRHLLIPVPSRSAAFEDTRSSGVHLQMRDLTSDEGAGRYLDLVCRRNDLLGAFTSLCVRVLELVAVAPPDIVLPIRRTLDAWREMFSRAGSAWTPSRIGGLHAELRVLERLLKVHPGATSSWTGPWGAPQDFQSARGAIEVKATTLAAGRVVRIHGADQLDTTSDRWLELVWMRLTAAPDGRTLGELLQSCSTLSADPSELERAVNELDLPESDDTLVAGLRFDVTEERWYLVDGTFPRVTPSSFERRAVPLGVGNLEYSVDLDSGPQWVTAENMGQSRLRDMF